MSVGDTKAAEEAFKRALETAKKREQEAVKNQTYAEIGKLWGAGAKKSVTAKRFCGCVKKVKSSKRKTTEGSAIAICTSSLLWPHGKTLHSVTCRRKNRLKTQKRKKNEGLV